MPAAKSEMSTTPSPPIEMPKKRTRRTKAEMKASKTADAGPTDDTEPEAAETEDGLFDDEPPVTKAASPEDVRAALVAFKNALAKRLVEKGTDEKEAGTKAMVKTKQMLSKVAGTEVLGSVPADKYAAVIEFAQKQIAVIAAS
jgi:hypothetical protein